VPASVSASASAAVPGKALVIYFGSGTAKLDEAAEKTLAEVLAVMKGDAARRLAIVGHADGSGDVKHNRWLGDFRAKVIARWLELRGIPRERCRIAEVVLAAPVDAGVGGAAAVDAEDPNLARDRRVELLWEAGPTP
jgi:OOP family OmpA-OmpF porin